MERALIGFGEAGQALAQGWQQEGLSPPLAFDLRAIAGAYGAAMQDRAQALRGSGAVFCLVTADRALDAARECAPHLPQGALWFDGNSCAPNTKRAAAQVISAAGGVYVDLAIMAPIHPRLHRTPMLVAGPQAVRAVQVLQGFGMQVRAVGDAVGAASSIKMIRSVMVKGMESLFAECFIAARKAGVEGEVIASLIASTPEINWPVQGAYNLERMMSHGLRRAAEMREVVQTLRDLGLKGDMTAAVADWQQALGEMGLKGVDGDLWERADLALARL